MRIALLSDIHGNSIALDAVLADIQTNGGVDEYWILGDLCAIGHDPVGVLERVAQLPNVRFVRGNTDRYTVTGALPNPTFAEVAKDASLIPKFAEWRGVSPGHRAQWPLPGGWRGSRPYRWNNV